MSHRAAKCVGPVGDPECILATEIRFDVVQCGNSWR